MMRYSVRIHLTEFIGSEDEKNIIDAMVNIVEKTNPNVFLKLWYRNGELTEQNVLDFCKRYEHELETIGTNIHVGEHEHWMNKSWFNIRRAGERSESEYRYMYLFSNTKGILEGIAKFRGMVAAMTAHPNMEQTSLRQDSQRRSDQQRSNKFRIITITRRVTHAPSTSTRPQTQTDNHTHRGGGQSDVDRQTENP